MFSLYHIIWMIICILFIGVTLNYLVKNKVKLDSFIGLVLIASVFVELVKIFSLTELVVNSQGQMVPYIDTQHIPFNLCGMQKFFLGYAYFTNNKSVREKILAFVYPTAMIGAFIAIFVPAGSSIPWTFEGALLNPQAYQFFLYHALLVVTGAYIALSKEFEFKIEHFQFSLAFMGLLAVIAVYLNSALANVTYQAGKAVEINYLPNYLFMYIPPIKGIVFTEKIHWFIYLGVIASLVIGAFSICHLPLIYKMRERKYSRRNYPKVQMNSFNGLVLRD